MVASAPVGWSAVARKDAVPVPPRVATETVRSRSGLRTLVVDANAIIGGASHLLGAADRFFTIRQVLEEVRDPISRLQMASVPLTLECVEPEKEAITKVVQFARATGDLQALSEVDLKLIALAYTLETQAHGTSHLRSKPPPLQVTPVQNHRQKEPPGWGTNVPNLQEWEELPEEDTSGNEPGEKHIQGISSSRDQSHILGLQSLSLNKMDETKHSAAQNQETSLQENTNSVSSLKHPKPVNKGRKPGPNLEGKSMAVGSDASKGEIEEEHSSDWVRACSRSTRRNFLKREARRAAQAVNPEQGANTQHGMFGKGVEVSALEEDIDEREMPDLTRTEEDVLNGKATKSDNLATIADALLDGETHSADTWLAAEVAEALRQDEQSSADGNEIEETRAFAAAVTDLEEEDAADLNSVQLDATGTLSEEESFADTSGEDCAISITGDTVLSAQGESEQSWTIRPSWQSSVACVTGDFAMQNVILQIGLRLLSPSGIHVRELHRWVLKCTACGKVTPEVGRIFCPKCGNGGTLYRVSVTVGANGSLHAGRIRRISLRGTRYSLPLPKGGREGAATNPILREDQLPHRLLYPKTKKKSANADLDFTTMDTIFQGVHAKNQGRSSQVREAVAIFGGRRNPNERRVARKH
ncbi:unnamed protein product [Sphagnum tenellum]